MRGATDAGQVNAALTDITPSTAGTEECSRGRHGWASCGPRRHRSGRWWKRSGSPPLTAMEIDRAGSGPPKPVVAPYAGEKTAVPSSPAVIEPAEATASPDRRRLGPGPHLRGLQHRVRGRFPHRRNPGLPPKSQTYFIDGHAAVTGPPAVPAADGILADATDLGPASPSPRP